MSAENSLKFLPYSKTTSLEVAKLMVELGWVYSIEEVYQEPTLDEQKIMEEQGQEIERLRGNTDDTDFSTLASLPYSGTRSLEVAQAMVELGWISSVNEVYQPTE